MKESLYSKLFNLFQLDSYFRHAALVLNLKSRSTLEAELPMPTASKFSAGLR